MLCPLCRVGQLLNTTDVWLMPSLNPDGFENAQRLGQGGGRACEGMDPNRGRQNLNRQDLNRNFPDQFRDADLLASSDHRSIFTGREPETVAAMKWIVSNPFVLSGK